MYTNNQTFFIKAFDTLPVLSVAILTKDDRGTPVPFSLTAVTACTFSMADSSGNMRIAQKSAQITSTCGQIQYNWTRVDTSVAGKYKGEFELYFSGGSTEQKMTLPLFGQIDIEIFSDVNKR